MWEVIAIYIAGVIIFAYALGFHDAKLGWIRDDFKPLTGWAICWPVALPMSLVIMVLIGACYLAEWLVSKGYERGRKTEK
jgi:hypothetical protein